MFWVAARPGCPFSPRCAGRGCNWRIDKPLTALYSNLLHLASLTSVQVWAPSQGGHAHATRGRPWFTQPYLCTVHSNHAHLPIFVGFQHVHHSHHRITHSHKRYHCRHLATLCFRLNPPFFSASIVQLSIPNSSGPRCRSLSASRSHPQRQTMTTASSPTMGRRRRSQHRLADSQLGAHFPTPETAPQATTPAAAQPTHPGTRSA